MTNELYHFGIKGQKWGVRRYQNEDGTLTSAGKKRYDYSDKQRRQDARLYGRRAPKRIQKRLENGESLLSARHAEVNRKKRIGKAKSYATAAAALAIPIVAPLTVAAIADRAEKKRTREINNRIKTTNESVKKMWSDYADQQRAIQDKSKQMFGRLNDALNKNVTKRPKNNDPNRSPGTVSDNWKRVLNNTNKRESDFQKKMKDYWEREGRAKWEKKNKRK